MAEPTIHERETPLMRPPQPRAAQGAVSQQGTIAVFEPGSGKLVGEVRVA